jgi:hypothetical protein
MSPRSLAFALDFLTRARGAQRGRRRQRPRGRGSKAAAPLGGERLEPRLALAVNFASGLPSDMTASAYLFIGDHSVSNSEIWRMNVAGTSLTAPGYGLVLREQGTFARGASYPITVDWLATNRAAGPDYDYRAWIDRSANPTWTSGSPTPSSQDFFVTDPGQLLQRRWFGSDVNATLGKTAEVHFPGIDLDVDSDNSGYVDGSPAEDALELVSTAGVNVPASMAGLTSLVVGLSDNLRHAATTGQVSFTFSSTAPTAFRLWRDAARTLPLPWGTAVTAAQLGLGFGGRLNLQLEAVTPTTSFAAITTTALVTGGIWQGTLQDTVRARGVPGVDLDVTPRAVTEDGLQGLTYTFSRAVATSTPLTVNYVLGGSATQAIDFTGLPAASSTRSITIPAGATTTSLTVFPKPDSEIEPDETVVLTLLPGTGYALGSKTVATGMIENDDYLLDLILDGLSEETALEPNELSPGAEILMGGGRTRLDLIIQSPANAGTVTLTVLSGADKITLWEAEEGGQQVEPGVWPVGQHPTTLWVEDTGLEGDFELVAMFQNKGTTTDDASKGKVVGAEWRTAWADPNGNQDGKNQITPTFKSLTYEVDVDLGTGDPAGAPPPGGPDDNALKGTAERLNKWTDAFAKKAGLGTDDEGRQFVGLFNPNPNKEKLPKQAHEFIKTGFERLPKDADYQHIGNAERGGQMRTNIWRIEFVPAVTPWEWNATITLPEWKQFTTDEDDLNPNVKEGWKKFVDALAGHEKIHKKKWEEYVRAYQSRVDAFAKTRFFGEAADPNNQTAKTSAWNDAKRLFAKEREKLHADLNALTVAYNEDQKLYDKLSDHGRNQEGYDPAGKNIEAVNNGLKLKR